LQNLSNRMS